MVRIVSFALYVLLVVGFYLADMGLSIKCNSAFEPVDFVAHRNDINTARRVTKPGVLLQKVLGCCCDPANFLWCDGLCTCATTGVVAKPHLNKHHRVGRLDDYQVNLAAPDGVIFLYKATAVLLQEFQRRGFSTPSAVCCRFILPELILPEQ